jgi:SAM-dependent methyltransferase
MADRQLWGARYADRADAGGRAPSQFLVAQRHRVPPGRALDLASGDGRHAIYLARHGWAVTAIDFARSALERLAAIARKEGLAIETIQADLEQMPLPRDRFDVVVNIRYLQRSLFEPMKAAVRRGGVIVFETFLKDQQQLGHPKNPAFMLDRGELAHRFGDFEILASEEGRFDTESGPAFLARLLARRP